MVDIVICFDMPNLRFGELFWNKSEIEVKAELFTKNKRFLKGERVKLVSMVEALSNRYTVENKIKTSSRNTLQSNT